MRLMQSLGAANNRDSAVNRNRVSASCMCVSFLVFRCHGNLGGVLARECIVDVTRMHADRQLQHTAFLGCECGACADLEYRTRVTDAAN